MLNITNNYLFTTLFSQYVKELFELNRSEDVWITNPRPRVTSNQLYIPFLKDRKQYKKELFGGGERSRTDDPLRARQML